MTNVERYQKLFEPGRIGSMRIKNRLIMPPVCTGFTRDHGHVTERLQDFYSSIARGGVGLIILEASCVDSPAGLHSEHMVNIDDDRFIPGLKQLTEAIKKCGARVAIQLSHAGASARTKVTGRQPAGPSPVIRPGGDLPRELTEEEIHGLVGRFAAAAKRAQQAGFDGVEIHAAYLYIFAQFLCTAWNKRQDAYGGSLENRARFLLETLAAVKEGVGRDYPVWCRVNGVEYATGGSFPPEEARQVAVMLEAAGADAIHVTAWGGYGGPYAHMHRLPMSEPGGNLLPLAEGIKKAVKIPVIAVGRIAPDAGEKALEMGQADFIAIGRALIADPELPIKAASGRSEDIRPCLACNSCQERLVKLGEIHCAVNAVVGREREYSIRPADKRRKVLIVGGGPAGMEAARVAALRGHSVTVYEEKKQLGGQMVLAAIPPHKETIGNLTAYLTTQLKGLPVQIKLGEKATASLVQKEQPDVLVLATGVLPLVPDIPGIGRPNVVAAESILTGKSVAGDKVVIVGGEMIGCEVAEFLADKGKQVTIARRGPALATKVEGSIREKLLSRLTARGVAILAGVQYQEITDRGLALVDKDGVARTVEADTVVIAAGSKPNSELLQAVQDRVPQVLLAGDSARPGTIMDAIADGYRTGLGL